MKSPAKASGAGTRPSGTSASAASKQAKFTIGPARNIQVVVRL